MTGTLTTLWTRVLVVCMLLNITMVKGYSQEWQVKIIANPSVSLTHIDSDQIRRIFTMYQTNWSNAQPIVVFVLPNSHPTHQLFSREILGLFPYQLDRIWNKLVYSGLGEGPIRLTNEAEMIKKIQQQPGAIGYLLTAEVPSGVNLIKLTEEL